MLKFRVKKGDEAITDLALVRSTLTWPSGWRWRWACFSARKSRWDYPRRQPRGGDHPRGEPLERRGAEEVLARLSPGLGNTTVQADAFLAGVVQVGDDLKQLRISVGAFGRGGELEKVVQFTAAMDDMWATLARALSFAACLTMTLWNRWR